MTTEESVTLAVEDTLEDCIQAAIAIALQQAVEEDEPVTIFICLSGSSECVTRKKGGHGCDLCKKVVVDQFGKINYEAGAQ